MKFYQHLAGQLALLVLVAALPLVSVIGYLLYDQVSQAETEATEKVEATAAEIARDTERLLQQTSRTADYLANRHTVGALSAAQCASQIAEIQRLNPMYVNAVLVDREGKTLCRSVAGAASLVSYGDRDWFQNGMKGIYGWGTPIVGRTTGKWLVPMTRGVLGDDGSVTGLINISLAIDEFVRLVQQPKLPDDSVITIFDQNGTIVARSQDLERWLGRNARVSATLAELFARPDGIAKMRGADGTLRLYSLATLPETKWRVSAGIPVQTVFAAYEARRNSALLAVGAATLLIAVVVLLLGRRISVPVRALADSAKAVAQGRLDRRVDETGPFEIAAVARQFNSMIDALSAANAVVKARTAELENANKELESFAYSVSHDLRAPLRSIDGFSQALIEDYAEKVDDQGKVYLRRLRSAAQRMALLIDDMLKLSRVTRTELVRKTVDISALAENVATDIKQSHPERPVTVSIMPGAVVSADESLLRLVLQNLLANAWKFTGRTAKANVEFGYAPRDGETTYYVRDNGAGFDMAYAGNLFAPFQRLHLATEFPGTGIGLAIVKHIVQRHGGRVWAEGTVDQGAAFYFTLPDPKPASIETVHPAAGHYRTARLTEEFAT